MERILASASAHAALTRRGEFIEALEARGVYTVECIGPDGEVRWTETIENLVTTQGKNSLLDKFLGLGAAHTNVLLALKGAGAAAAADTYASHAGWAELTDYTGNRPAAAFAAASGGSKVTSAAVAFAITGTVTVAGVALMMSASTTKGDTALAGAILLSAGDFSGGSRALVSGDTLNCNYSLAL